MQSIGSFGWINALIDRAVRRNLAGRYPNTRLKESEEARARVPIERPRVQGFQPPSKRPGIPFGTAVAIMGTQDNAPETLQIPGQGLLAPVQFGFDRIAQDGAYSSLAPRNDDG